MAPGVAVLVIGLASVLCACDRAKQGAKEVLNTGGEIAGKAATEVLEGVTTGVEETWKVEVRLSPELQQRGMTLGRTTVESDTLGNDNVLIVYIATSQAVHDTLHIIALDKDSLEMGRASLPIEAAAGSGDHYEIRFPARTDLERKSLVLIR